MSIEEIVPIPGMEGYGVSRDGRVWSKKNGKWGFRNWWKELKQAIDSRGYLCVNLTLVMGKKQKTCLVHKLVVGVFINTIPPSMDVNHINGNKKDNNVSNLEIVTRSENMKHAFSINLCSNSGESNPRAKLTYSQVMEIMNSKQVSMNALSRQFGVSRSTIRDIQKGRSWKKSA